eukprot:9697137-Lingulodinium_polyedra.AAC.1
MPLDQRAAVVAVQWVSCTRTTVSLFSRDSSSAFFPCTRSESRSMAQRRFQEATPAPPGA